jgi:hypothetical protein
MTQAEQIIGGGFDIDQLDSQSEQILHKVTLISDIDGNDKCGFFIDSKNCKEFQDATHQVRIDGLKRSSKRKTALDTSTNEGAGAVAKMIESNDTTLACSVVKGWFGFQSKGVDAQFDKAAVVKMFAKFPTWQDKVTAALDNEANFFKG